MDVKEALDLLRGHIKTARKVVHFREKDLPGGPKAERKAKRIYYGMKGDKADLKKRYGKRWKEVAARTAFKKSKKER